MDFNTRSSNAISEKNLAGQIQKVFGTNGELVIKIWDNFPEEITEEPLWIEINSKGVPLFIKSIKNQGSSRVIAVFEDWETENLARELVGKSVYFETDQDSEDSLGGLCGWQIIDKNSGRIGEINDFNDSDINPLLFAIFDGKECMIPLAEEYIVLIDELNKKIEVKLPEGLLDL